MIVELVAPELTMVAAVALAHVHPRSRRFVRRAGAAARLMRDAGALPRWARAALAVCCLPIPGPVDELLAVCVVAVLWRRHRETVRECWRVA